MTKNSVFSLAELLKPAIQKKNTKYRLSIPVLIRVACTLFKLTHGANLTVCSETFAVGRSTVCKMMREGVHAINDSLKHEVSWPSPHKIRESQTKFVEMCSLPAVIGAIDGMQISIAKPDYCPADYYYFKLGGYSMNSQAVVDADKRFIDLYIGMPGSTNDSRMLRQSTLHYLASQGNLITSDFSVDEHSPYLLGDLGYPLLPWLMVPHRGGRQLSVSQMLFNRKLQGARCVVENAFGILKHTFRELLVKTDLHLAFLPDVILTCAILYNIILGQSAEEVDNLFNVLQNEGMGCDEEDDIVMNAVVPPVNVDENTTNAARQKRHALGVYLSTRRRGPQSPWYVPFHALSQLIRHKLIHKCHKHNRQIAIHKYQVSTIQFFVFKIFFWYFSKLFFHTLTYASLHTDGALATTYCIRHAVFSISLLET